ncbi:hypothetical protein TNCV_3411191 [Trichonephila clavipes]|nr:hypothetical protein TNCV_3411191 [Trichonephila clavipes]
MTAGNLEEGLSLIEKAKGVYLWCNAFESGKSTVTDDDGSGSSVTSIIDKNVDVIDPMIRKGGRRAHDIANDLNISYASVSIGALSPLMIRGRNAFPLPACVLSGDKAHFWLNGYVNKQNCRIWSEVNPQVYVETSLHPEKLTVWCAICAGGILQKR